MKKFVKAIQLSVISVLFLLPVDSKCQDGVVTNKIAAKDSITLLRYLKNTEKSRLLLATLPTSNSPIKLNFKIPQVKVYYAADYYVDGKFSCLPYNNWMRHQVPFYLNQPIFIQVKEK